MPVAQSSRQLEEFRTLVREQLPRLYAAARALVGDEAEDAVQDCMVKAFERYGQLHEQAAAAAWLRSILVNCCRDRLRARARQPEPVDFGEAEDFSLFRKIAYEDPFPYSDSLHLDFLQGFGPEDVRAVLLGLPDIYRVPLVLVHMQGYLAKETATILQVPLGTVLARLHRGRKLFEKRMWDYAQTNGLLKEVRR
ncbi:RNA polymerase sigma factor [Streptomyces sp. NPDC050803]|uniref:RNA polymerase sigma factor n=1 Tax=unclassified Streptomyces TaxID=2593676 RepID=UPI003437843B